MRFLAYVVAWHVLLRGDELTVVTCDPGRLEVDSRARTATLHITGDKTNIACRDRARTLGCCCAAGGNGALLCPTHACAALQQAGRKRAGKRALSSEPLLVKENGRAYSTANLLYWFRLDLGAVGVKLTGVRGEELWGLHAFRRGGAQALAAAG